MVCPLEARLRARSGGGLFASARHHRHGHCGRQARKARRRPLAEVRAAATLEPSERVTRSRRVLGRAPPTRSHGDHAQTTPYDHSRPLHPICRVQPQKSEPLRKKVLQRVRVDFWEVQRVRTEFWEEVQRVRVDFWEVQRVRTGFWEISRPNCSLARVDFWEVQCARVDFWEVQRVRTEFWEKVQRVRTEFWVIFSSPRPSSRQKVQSERGLRRVLGGFPQKSTQTPFRLPLHEASRRTTLPMCNVHASSFGKKRLRLRLVLGSEASFASSFGKWGLVCV
jgi:hypothetical protein